MPNVLKLPLPNRCGATRDEWINLSMLQGLTADLLPVVSNMEATISPDSKMQALGKTPSWYNRRRQAAGIPDWPSRQSVDRDIESWMDEPDYGVCIQTRRVRALDVDVENKEEALAISQFISSKLTLPTRYRSNSSKFLMPFILEGDYRKRSFKTRHGLVEFLANGNQFVACGQHASGVRYEWEGGMLDDVPKIDAQTFDSLWNSLIEHFAVGDATQNTKPSRDQKVAEVVANDPIAKYLLDKNLVKRIERNGVIHVTCPWEEYHTTDSGDTATSYFPPNTGGYALGHFKCLHAHCEGRTDSDYLEAIGYVDDSVLSDFDVLSQTNSSEGQTEGAKPQTEEGDSQTVKPKFVVENALEFTSYPTASWLVKNVLPKADLAVLYGDSGSGKTFFALDIGAAVALGEEWRGHKVKQGRVVFIAAEGAGGFRNRLKAYAHQHQVDLATLPIGVIAAAPNMLDKTDALEVAKAIIAAGGADLIILDTFAQVMPGANENSGEDVGKALAHCKGLNRATGALVLLVHHSGKDSSKGARGWSGLRAAADVEIEVVRSEDARAATVTKLKDGGDGSSFGFKLHTVVVGEDEDGEDITSCVLEHNDSGRPRRQQEPKGKNGRLAIRVLTEMVDADLSGDGIAANELVDAMVSNMVHEEGKRDQRRALALRAIDSLMADGRIESIDGKLKIKGV
jgi:AAA domain/Bifunctional DNA primase/polymerase, N-terminal